VDYFPDYSVGVALVDVSAEGFRLEEFIHLFYEAGRFPDQVDMISIDLGDVCQSLQLLLDAFDFLIDPRSVSDCFLHVPLEEG
jgi:hypothetical protein